MEKTKIIMDCDTGSDDAIAIILAILSPKFDIIGLTSVNGNVEVKNAADNTLRVVDFLGKGDEIPVFLGCDYPMVSTLLPWRKPGIPEREGNRKDFLIHADHIDLPEATSELQEKQAVIWLIETLMASDGDITLVPIGPLTNIAMAMRIEPRIIPKIREIVIMGGGHNETSTSAAAEYNIWIDPESAEIVLQSGCKIVMMPLDFTLSAPMTLQDAKDIRAIGTKESDAVARFIEGRVEGYNTTYYGGRFANEVPIHDALCICYLEHPEVIAEAVVTNVHIDISHGFADGATIIDRRSRIGSDAPNCTFCLKADKDLFLKWIMDTLSR